MRGETGIARGLQSGSDAVLVNLWRRKSFRVETGQEGSTWVTSHWSLQTAAVHANAVGSDEGEFDEGGT